MFFVKKLFPRFRSGEKIEHPSESGEGNRSMTFFPILALGSKMEMMDFLGAVARKIQ